MSENEIEFERMCRWVRERILVGGKVTRSEFFKEFEKRDERDSNRDQRLSPNWHRASHAVRAILQSPQFDVGINKSELTLTKTGKSQDAGSPADRYRTTSFHPDVEGGAKQHIGQLIAEFLTNDLLAEKTIFLGSGSTVFHVGLAMRDSKKHYKQRFVTVNMALAAEWCMEPERAPVSKISIPGAVLDTQSFRFSTMPGPGWPLTISIVAADGCFYDRDKKEVVLYGNEESVATNTNLFVQNTQHSVIFCLTGAKLRRGFMRLPNTGPPILPPKDDVIRVLVTEDPYETAVGALEQDEWMIVTEQKDWARVLDAMRKGETAAYQARVEGKALS